MTDLTASAASPHKHATTVMSLGTAKRELSLVHIEKPLEGGHSLAKGQCDLWEYVWGCSVLTCNVLADLDFRGLRILELGCGSGLCSLTCALAGAREVVATDLVKDALDLVKASARLNGIPIVDDCKCEEGDRAQCQCALSLPLDVAPRDSNAKLGQLRVARYNWDKRERLAPESFDMVICSDVLFFRGTAAPVSKTIARALRPGGVAFIADPCRLNVEDFTDRLRDGSMDADVDVYRFKDESTLVGRANDLADASKAAAAKASASGSAAGATFVQVTKAKLVVVQKHGPSGPSGKVLAELVANIKQRTFPNVDS